MSEDWEKLAGERGERVTTSRLKRMWRLGSVGAGVAASSLAGKVKSAITGEQEDAQAIHRKNAQRLVQVMGQLKGASMKIGQILSADPELLPPEFSQGMTALQRDAPPMTYATVKAQIEAALERPMETVFAWFDPEPLGAASIGQVHRARLESGEDVAVKVQYPGVAESLESDLKTLKSMLTAGRTLIDRQRLDHYFEEIGASLRQEADYTLEARNLERFSALLQEGREGVRAPKPYLQWTAPQVLVMEYVAGRKLDEALETMTPQERAPILARWVDLYAWMFHEANALHADPHPGNFLLNDAGELIVLDFGCVRDYEPAFTDGMLEILACIWDDDHARAIPVYKKLGFGRAGMDFDSLDPKLLAEYHDIILAPFMRDEAFDFASWKPAMEGKAWMLGHPTFWGLVPPPEALLYLRVLSAIKGLLAKLDAKINVYGASYATAVRRGVVKP